MDRVEPEYTMQAVVARTGVPADTIRSWERRHGFPRPARDGTNQRVYSETEIRAIIKFNELRTSGWSIPRAISQLQSSKIRTTDEKRDSPPTTSALTVEPSPSPSPRLRSPDDLAVLLDSYEAHAARQFLDDALAFGTVEGVCFSLLLPLSAPPASAETAHSFRMGFIRQALFGLYNASSPDSGRAAILILGVPGTRSESHLLCHAICASRGGYQTVFLGADVALNNAERAIATIQPQAVMMMADSETSAWTLARWSERLTRERPIQGWTGMLLFCGSIFIRDPALAEEVVAVRIPDQPEEAKAVLERTLKDATPSPPIGRAP